MWFGTFVAAHAQDLSFDAVTAVPAGNAASVSFHAAVDGAIRASVTCDGRTYPLERSVRAGATATLPLDGLRVGRHRCAGTVRLDQPSGAWAEAPLAFEVQVLDAIGWTVAASDVDLAARTLVVHPSRPVKAATVELRGAGGAVLGTESATLTDRSNPTFSWTTDAEVVALAVEVVDEAGIAGSLVLSPWSYAIPHEDVVFASGSDAIPASEAPKLERCWADVQRVVAKYGSVVEIRLFVAGYTDTVGAPDANLALSERRARAIARWFAQRGFDGGIAYQGFGEEVLAVSTADEVGEAANRRALYLLAAEQPPISRELPRSDWRSP
ncbi:MAG: OmpA family protein [Myxococcota bacterium]